MTDDVICKKGKCEYKEEILNEEWDSGCPGCELDEQIEHELSKKARRR